MKIWGRLRFWAGQMYPQELQARPHLAAWYAGILALPASRGVLDLELS